MTRLGAVLLGLGAAMLGCTSADDGDWVVRPPGGGTGVGGQMVDAGAVDADGDGGTGLVGHLCVVTELQTPTACAGLAKQAGVTVRRLGDTTGALTDSDGAFVLAVTGSPVILEAAHDEPRLQASVVPVNNTGAEVEVPVPTVGAWSTALATAATTVTSGNGSIVVYVKTAAGTPAEGVRFDLPPGGIAGPFYDDDGGAWTAGVGTGARGAVLFTDLPDATYTLAGRDAGNNAIAITGVPVAADRVTFVSRRLP